MTAQPTTTTETATTEAATDLLWPRYAEPSDLAAASRRRPERCQC